MDLSGFAAWLQNVVFKVNFWHCAVLLAIICLIYDCIQNPVGAINTFVIMIEDIAFQILPSTPSQYKLYSMLDSFASSYPAIGWGAIYQIFSGIAGMLNIYFGIRVLRFIPFFGG